MLITRDSHTHRARKRKPWLALWSCVYNYGQPFDMIVSAFAVCAPAHRAINASVHAANVHSAMAIGLRADSVGSVVFVFRFVHVVCFVN